MYFDSHFKDIILYLFFWIVCSLVLISILYQKILLENDTFFFDKKAKFFNKKYILPTIFLIFTYSFGIFYFVQTIVETILNFNTIKNDSLLTIKLISIYCVSFLFLFLLMSSIKILILYKIFLSKTTLFFYLKIYRSKWFKLFYLELKIYNFAIKNWNKRKNINNPLIIYELSDEQIIKYSNFIRKTSIYTKEDLKILFSKLESILKNEENIILMYQIEELVYKILFKDEFQNFKSFYKHINKIQDYEKINNNIYFIK